MARGVTQERFTQLVQERGYSVKEEQRSIYYSSLGRWYDEIFLSVMDGEKVKSSYNKDVLARWIPELMLIKSLDEE